uniref:Cyclic nucleotide-binding domain-containing protein n=1 Tax=Caenorhabditis tropicalis TaxID=1561998 RepID=A0A1I7UR09_9PELO
MIRNIAIVSLVLCAYANTQKAPSTEVIDKILGSAETKTIDQINKEIDRLVEKLDEKTRQEHKAWKIKVEKDERERKSRIFKLELILLGIVALITYFLWPPGKDDSEGLNDWKSIPSNTIQNSPDIFIDSPDGGMNRSPAFYPTSPLRKPIWSMNKEETPPEKPRGSWEKLSRPPPRELFEPTLEGLELPRSWQLDPRDVDTLSIDSGGVVLKPGDQNDVVIVVISGELGIFTTVNSGEKQYECNMKTLKSGESYFSQTSIIEILMNEKPTNKYIHLKALTNCRVAKYKLTSFCTSFISDPQQWIRTIQVVMTRLQQCTLITCNMYLGIGGKCIDAKRKIPDPRQFVSFDKLSEEEQTNRAVKLMAEAMGIPGQEEVLKGKVKRYECQTGTVVTEENSFEIDMIFVVYGKLRLRRGSMETDETGTSLAFDVYPGDILPSMQILTNEPAMCTATTMEKTIYYKIAREEYIQFLFAHPLIYLRLAFHALQFVSPFARVFDLAISWHRIETGQALFRLGDKSDCMYIVMGGRLRAVDSSKIIEEYGRLDLIGITDMAEKRTRRCTVMAIRFSHIVCVPENLLSFVKLRYPQVGNKLLQLISKCWKPPTPESLSHVDTNKIQNLRTIAIVPASKRVPLTAFTCELYNQLSKHVKLLRLSSTVIGNYFEQEVLTKKMDFGLMHWLNVQEIAYSLVLYECDFKRTSWTRRCLRMADAILVVANGNESRDQQDDSLLSCNEKGVRQSKELVLLWPENTPTPRGTAAWISESYYSGYHHLRAPNRVFSFPVKTPEKKIVEYYESTVYGENISPSDFSRLARILTGHAIGVVFGGGGARGAAHAGALRALIEKKVPIDMVGGTSIGALFGSLYATSPDIRAVGRMKNFFTDRLRNNIMDVLRDLTWAYCAILTGHRFNLCVQRMLDEVKIEDCWISYFCITTDLTSSSMRIHRSGLMWPVVRSSMSIAGYVPPICDPQDGHLLLDGAYVNNLPADVMKSLGANVVIAIDVGMSDETMNLRDYGYSISGTWCLFKRWWPFGEELRVMNMNEIQNRLAYVCCVNQLETVKNAPYCYYIKLPIENFGIFDFSIFDQAAKIGYDVTCQKLEEFFEDSVGTRRKLLGCARNVGLKAQKSRNDNVLDFVNIPVLPRTPNDVKSD